MGSPFLQCESEVDRTAEVAMGHQAQYDIDTSLSRTMANLGRSLVPAEHALLANEVQRYSDDYSARGASTVHFDEEDRGLKAGSPCMTHLFNNVSRFMSDLMFTDIYSHCP